MKSLSTFLKEAPETKEITIVVSPSGYEPLLKILENLKYYGNAGSSREVSFGEWELGGWDGDGSDKIWEIK